ncbi:MAG TPA: YicC/YloC family endoribonuclease [Steroidobacteraceae bacterium]|nr:YicC/YloC family endoribonuclease [Steroidobacteraceae bacterium]
MTGFARAERTTAAGLLAWEIRGVNHRYLEVSLRLPEELRVFEAGFRRAIGAAVRRGKVDAALWLRPGIASARELQVDEALLDRVMEQAQAIERRLGAAGRIDAIDLLRWPGVVREPERDPGPLAQAAEALLGEALTAFVASRAAEGERIAEMLRSRAAAVRRITDAVAARLPEVQSRIRARLRERLAALGAEGNPERLEQEIAILVQKMDVAEELDRLGSHVTELETTLAADDAVGRKLDFLMQEFNREANTLSSKSQDIETTRSAMELKVLVEQMREQVQNVE